MREEGISRSRAHQHRQCSHLTQDKTKNHSSDYREALARHPLTVALFGCERSSSKWHVCFARTTKPKIQILKFKIVKPKQLIQTCIVFHRSASGYTYHEAVGLLA